MPSPLATLGFVPHELKRPAHRRYLQKGEVEKPNIPRRLKRQNQTGSPKNPKKNTKRAAARRPAPLTSSACRTIGYYLQLEAAGMAPSSSSPSKSLKQCGFGPRGRPQPRVACWSSNMQVTCRAARQLVVLPEAGEQTGGQSRHGRADMGEQTWGQCLQAEAVNCHAEKPWRGMHLLTVHAAWPGSCCFLHR